MQTAKCCVVHSAKCIRKIARDVQYCDSGNVASHSHSHCSDLAHDWPQGPIHFLKSIRLSLFSAYSMSEVVPIIRLLRQSEDGTCPVGEGIEQSKDTHTYPWGNRLKVGRIKKVSLLREKNLHLQYCVFLCIPYFRQGAMHRKLLSGKWLRFFINSVHEGNPRCQHTNPKIPR